MELQELEKQLAWLNKKLFVMLEEQPKLVDKSGEAEKQYRIALATKILELKADDQKITLIPDIAKGDKKVAGLRADTGRTFH